MGKYIRVYYKKRGSKKESIVRVPLGTHGTVNIGIGIVPLKELPAWFYTVYGVKVTKITDGKKVLYKRK